ncbi:hypothetical protein PoB_005435600 [Plakobranchus ocellatus]|uniref:Uncharacterized protein n=1 Tax=Plakobranchus ocellatus TaxID=259542 RepID=A0AAV4BXG7_9GAST|nr:hypothetical protein PoB_005435600 [Plakobranchus ocellatus]
MASTPSLRPARTFLSRVQTPLQTARPGPPSCQHAGNRARTRDSRVTADHRAASLAICHLCPGDKKRVYVVGALSFSQILPALTTIQLTLRSAGMPLSRVRAPLLALRPNGGLEYLRSTCCGLVTHINPIQLTHILPNILSQTIFENFTM